MIAFLLQVWDLTRPYRGRLVLGILTGIISGLLEPLMIGTVTFVYGMLFPAANDAPVLLQADWVPAAIRDWLATTQIALGGGSQVSSTMVIPLVSLIPAVILLRGLFAYLNVYFLQWAAIRAITDLRIRLFEHLMNLSAGFFSRISTGELMSRVMNDTGMLQNVISNAASVMVKDPVTLIGLLAYLMWQQPKLTLISLAVLPLCMFPIIAYSRKVRRSSRAIQTHIGELSNVMSESFTGNRVIKAYNLEAIVVEQFHATARKFIGHFMRIVRSMEIPGPLLEFIGSFGFALVLIYLTMESGGRANAKYFLTIVLAIFSIYRPLKNLTRLHNTLEQARAASERIFELLATQNSITDPCQPKLLAAAGAPIEFDRVSFSYGEKTVLHDIQLTIQPGQLVALVGGSGSGKTTLTNLLLRFFDPQKGVVRIGGVDIREVAQRELRRQIAVVTQEVILFNDTIRYNISLGRPGATEAEIEAAARLAHAHDFILDKPQGYNAIIGEKGVNLSGGQRQRVAIARAVLKNAPILILDEATSSLDTESERIVQAALDELMQGRSTLCIAHRLSTIQNADLIVVLNQGRIVETGRHGELMQRGGYYQKLHEMQFQGKVI